MQKYELLQALGWTVIRVVQGDLERPELLVARIRAALAAAS